MSMGFILAPARLVRGENQFPEFRDAIAALQKAAIARAQDQWAGYSLGGVRPGDKEFGLTTLRPRDVFTPGGNTAVSGGTATWVKSYGSQGSWCNIFSYNVPQNEIHAFAGATITDPSLIFAQMKWTFADRKYPIVDIEEAHAYPGGFSLLFKMDAGEESEYIAVENDAVLLEGFQERATRARQQRVVPIGFQLYRNRDLHITKRETGN